MTNWCGGCACGAIRHECEGKPATTSTAIAAIASEQPAVPIAAFAIKEAVSLKGKPCWYRVIGSSGKPIECGFCLTCGNPMTVRLDVAPDIIGFHAASLDGPARYKPAVDLFTASAHPWDLMQADTIKKAGGLAS